MSQSTLNIIYIIWILSEVYLNRRLRSGSTDKKDQDKNSLRLIWIVIGVCVFTAVFTSHVFFLPIYHSSLGVYIGVAALILGILIRYWAVLSLGRFFTVDVTIREEHKLKTGGMYKYLRHPSYAASLLSFLGMGITLNNWFSLALIAVGIISVFIYRIKIEEKVLIEHFGSEYEDYRKHTSAIIPFVF
ncbi:protein-S-isoprenylcysteine O-methyltransferase Ste14 [Pedobacter sp. UYP30]|uniref:methyltransferase family protein n=1 Tax=Pedobacter sp. UYP30 TaxID=1756400 RepID=UPI003393C51B